MYCNIIGEKNIYLTQYSVMLNTGLWVTATENAVFTGIPHKICRLYRKSGAENKAEKIGTENPQSADFSKSAENLRKP